jgi:hypothetical protein
METLSGGPYSDGYTEFVMETLSGGPYSDGYTEFVVVVKETLRGIRPRGPTAAAHN